MDLTLQQYDRALKKCRELFVKKTRDYGTAWCILRPSSFTDQLYIKAKRIRGIEEGREQKISDSVEDEFKALVNYSLMALIRLSPNGNRCETEGLPTREAIRLYDDEAAQTRQLMQNKNHDYGEAWRDMRLSSLTDLILMKILRLKQIEDNQGKTIASEGPEGSYRDIANYALFALIKLHERQNTHAS